MTRAAARACGVSMTEPVCCSGRWPGLCCDGLPLGPERPSGTPIPAHTTTRLTAPATRRRRMAANARASRDVAHDTTLRFLHGLRITLRELGSRRVAADLIDVAEDIYYLTTDELVIMPADARLRVKRRRTERERLQAMRPPDVIDNAWQPVGGRECLSPGAD